ncbi:phenylalanine--tRNA ligase beta subunit [Natronomonas moolapensis 8.8.11]|uniref:Phenylalanine--tRNA ligase beta subunit n=1 Tax=Natronomonas moolapensis (strain DSM 18674 / CECT 7526 / JCM 14361 / 8.8.11) TaxID=268739 RepID=M1XU55_NATM8|nr:phenylalanine--tRNA ligase beta subunit-related protein [Natronomonas moolapensis]CCQ38001.1 phenylalanine--tRNA ligase beta subunit [Natronomonas moolapensis 8.8.11]
MPVVEVDPDELRALAGAEHKPDAELKEDLFSLGLEFEGETESGGFELEFAPDRLDRLSVEGIARSLRYQYGHDRGVYVPETNDAEWAIEVDGSVPEERPYVTGAVVRGLDLDESRLESLIQLQEKLHATMGRGRAKGAIGVHDLAMLKGQRVDDEEGETEGTNAVKTITYRGVDPDGDRFVPLDDDAERTPAEVLETHPTGDEYADLVEGLDRYPAIYDDIGLFSFPPVINGTRTEVDEGSRDLLVEMTGTDQWTIDRMLAIVCYALDARGGRIEDVEIRYGDRELHRPDLSTSRKRVAHDRIERTLGIDVPGTEVVDLLERAGLDAAPADGGTRDRGVPEDAPDPDAPDDVALEAVPSRTDGPDTALGGSDAAAEGPAGEAATEPATDEGLIYEVEIPPYRVDVLHPADVVDDVGRAYGFNDLDPTYPNVSTVGGRHASSRLAEAARDALVGLGFEDLLNFHMTNEAELFDRMGLAPGDDALGASAPPTITEPYSEAYTVVRTWALPSLLMVLENNTHRAYPQDLAEIGLVAGVDSGESTGIEEHRSVAGALARTDASYEDAKARLRALADAFGASLSTPPTTHPSFIDGRAAEVVLDGESVGVVGELHPKVLVEHDLELPVAAFEFRLDGLR